MRHERFYVTGTWISEELSAYVGWAELEDESRTWEPLASEDGNKVLVFSGDEFPDPGMARRLRERGHDVAGEGFSYLVHAAEEDVSFPAGLNGCFHGVLADRAAGTVTLFIDRFAARRLYYHQARDGFYFAAEAKALIAARPELRRLDARGLGELVSCGCVLEDRSLFEGIRQLPSAAAWTFQNGTLQHKASYFSPRQWEEQDALEPEPYYRELRDAFARSLPRYFRAGERMALSLTGGLDTRMILSWHKPAPGEMPCYTFGGPDRESRDVRIARRVAEFCRQPYRVIAVGSEFLERFADYAERTVYLTDGNASVEQSPGLYANRQAREIAPIRLTGNYGDEILRRRIVFRPTPTGDGVFRPEFTSQIAAAGETYARMFSPHPLTNAAGVQIASVFYALDALESSQVKLRTPFLDNDLIRTAYRAPGHTFVTNDLRVRIIRDGDPRLARIRTDLGFAGRGGQAATAVWHFIHRATMRAEYAFEHADPRWVARMDRTLLSGMLENAFVGMHKFTHFALWYRDALAGYVREMLLDTRTLARPYLDAGNVERLVESHVRGEANHTPTIHKLLTLEYIHRLFLDAE